MPSHPNLSDSDALLVLNALAGIGPVTLRRLLDAFGDDPVAILSAERKQLKAVPQIRGDAVEALLIWRERFDPAEERAKMKAVGARWVSMREPEYPAWLRETHDPPIGLYVRGRLPGEQPCISIVGTRRPTNYGKSTARMLAAELSRAGFCIVSGLARGIDTEAHEGALSAEGATLAVMGCGIDRVYPPENRKLYKRMAEEGGIATEFLVGTGPETKNFPMRNRIVAGLCRALIVVESDEKGGSMITARQAVEQGRTVFAVPGRIDQPQARGCLKLLREGAAVLTSPQDVLDELSYTAQMEMSWTGPDSSGEDGSASLPGLLDGLSEEEARVMQALADGSLLTPDAVASQLGLAVPSVTAALMKLELLGRASKKADGTYEVLGG